MYHRNLRGQSISSFLKEIKGVGKKTSEKIWKEMKTKENIFNAEPEDFVKIGVPTKTAIEIYNQIHSK